MAEFDEATFRADIAMPTDEQVERAARLLAIAQGEPMDMWPSLRIQARAALIIHLNAAIIHLNAAKWRIGL